MHGFHRLLPALLTIAALVSDGSAQRLAKKELSFLKATYDSVDLKAFDGNRIECAFANDLRFASDGDGFILHWPRPRMSHLMSGASPWIIGKERTSGTIHSAVGTWGMSDFQPGTIDSIFRDTLAPGGPHRDPRFRIYKIQRSDTLSNTNPDYVNWPSSLGAPVEASGKPKFYGDQQLFFVANDLNTIHRASYPGSMPMGIEVRALVWGSASDSLIRDVMFLRWEIINKSIHTYDSTYFGFWSDVDINDVYWSDLLGFDTTTGTAYVYSAEEYDRSWGDSFARRLPAVGFQILKGAVGIHGEHLRATSSMVNERIPSGDYGDILVSTPISTLYKFIQGLGVSGNPMVDPTTGIPSRIQFTGDPVTGTGWLPSLSGIGPEDLRMIVGSGPFTFAPGDTQTVVGAIVLAQGADRLSSVSKLRWVAKEVQRLYETGLDNAVSADPAAWSTSLPGDSALVTVNARMNGVTGATASLVRHDGSPAGGGEMFDDGLHGDGTAGDGVFGAQVALPVSRDGLRADMMLHAASGDSIFYLGAISSVPTLIPPVIGAPQVVTDDKNQDGVINPGETVQFRSTFINVSGHALDALGVIMVAPNFSILSHVPAMGVDSTSIPDGTATLTVSAHAPVQQHLPIGWLVLEPSHNNIWSDTSSYVVMPFTYQPLDTLAAHIAGPGTGTFGIRLVDPTAWKNHLYQLTVPQGTRCAVVDQDTKDTVLGNFDYGPLVYGGTSPATDGFIVTRGTITNLDGPADNVLEVKGPGGARVRDGAGDAVFHSANSTNEWSFGGTNSWGYAETPSALNTLWGSRGDVEIRFSRAGSPYYLYVPGSYTMAMASGTVPFELWMTGDTPDDPTDDIRLPVLIQDLNNNGRWDAFADQSTSEPIFSVAGELDPGPQANTVYTPYQIPYGGYFFYQGPARTFAVPREGTVVRIVVRKAPSTRDVYVFRPSQLDQRIPELPVRLEQNYPNPFNPSTNILYSVFRSGHVSVVVYNLLGQEVRRLVDAEQDPGTHLVIWNGRNTIGAPVPSGVYLCRILLQENSQVRKMLLLR